MNETDKLEIKGLLYKGYFIKGINYSNGDVVIKDGETMIFTGEVFIPINNGKATIDEKVKISPRKCKCCGASLVLLDGIIKCQYCGTFYTKEGEQHD